MLVGGGEAALVGGLVGIPCGLPIQRSSTANPTPAAHCQSVGEVMAVIVVVDAGQAMDVDVEKWAMSQVVVGMPEGKAMGTACRQLPVFGRRQLLSARGAQHGM